MSSSNRQNDGMLYLEGHGDLVSGLVIRITRVTIWVIGVINLLTKSPDPPSMERGWTSTPRP